MFDAVKRCIQSSFRLLGMELRRDVPIAEVRRQAYASHLRDCWGCLQAYDARTVLDIGANEGQFAALIRELIPEVKIISFEPLRDCYDVLMSKQPELAPSMVFHTALGREAGTAKINRSVFTPSSSLLPMGTLHRDELPHTAESVEEEISVRVLDDMLAGLELGEPYLVKIDVQGFEEEVLRGADKTLQKSIAVVVEVSANPMYVGEPGFDRIYEIMKSHGFVYCGNVDQWRSSKDGRILQFDCLFENRALRSTL